MLPISIYLTSRATKDRSLLDLDAIFIPFKKLIQRTQIDKTPTLKVFDENSEAFFQLNEYSNKKLRDIKPNVINLIDVEYNQKILFDKISSNSQNYINKCC